MRSCVFWTGGDDASRATSLAPDAAPVERDHVGHCTHDRNEEQSEGGNDRLIRCGTTGADAHPRAFPRTRRPRSAPAASAAPGRRRRSSSRPYEGSSIGSTIVMRRGSASGSNMRSCGACCSNMRGSDRSYCWRRIACDRSAAVVERAFAKRTSLSEPIITFLGTLRTIQVGAPAGPRHRRRGRISPPARTRRRRASHAAILSPYRTKAVPSATARRRVRAGGEIRPRRLCRGPPAPTNLDLRSVPKNVMIVRSTTVRLAKPRSTTASRSIHAIRRQQYDGPSPACSTACAARTHVRAGGRAGPHDICRSDARAFVRSRG